MITASAGKAPNHTPSTGPSHTHATPTEHEHTHNRKPSPTAQLFARCPAAAQPRREANTASHSTSRHTRGVAGPGTPQGGPPQPTGLRAAACLHTQPPTHSGHGTRPQAGSLQTTPSFNQPTAQLCRWDKPQPHPNCSPSGQRCHASHVSRVRQNCGAAPHRARHQMRPRALQVATPLSCCQDRQRGSPAFQPVQAPVHRHGALQGPQQRQPPSILTTPAAARAGGPQHPLRSDPASCKYDDGPVGGAPQKITPSTQEPTPNRSPVTPPLEPGSRPVTLRE